MPLLLRVIHPAATLAPRPACLPAARLRRRHPAGLTLIELMIGLVLASILISIGMPSSSAWITRHRLAGQAGTLGTAMAYAKGESIARGVRVTVCTTATPTASRPACSNPGNWSESWLVFVDNTQRAGNTPGAVDAEDTVLRVGSLLDGATGVADAAVRDWVAFTPDGLALGSGGVAMGSINLCLKNQSRRVSISRTGLVSSTSGTC